MKNDHISKNFVAEMIIATELREAAEELRDYGRVAAHVAAISRYGDSILKEYELFLVKCDQATAKAEAWGFRDIARQIPPKVHALNGEMNRLRAKMYKATSALECGDFVAADDEARKAHNAADAVERVFSPALTRRIEALANATEGQVAYLVYTWGSADKYKSWGQEQTPWILGVFLNRAQADSVASREWAYVRSVLLGEEDYAELC